MINNYNSMSKENKKDKGYEIGFKKQFSDPNRTTSYKTCNEILYENKENEFRPLDKTLSWN